jgi:hypothetical protein
MPTNKEIRVDEKYSIESADFRSEKLKIIRQK